MFGPLMRIPLGEANASVVRPHPTLTAQTPAHERESYSPEPFGLTSGVVVIHELACDLGELEVHVLRELAEDFEGGSVRHLRAPTPPELLDDGFLSSRDRVVNAAATRVSSHRAVPSDRILDRRELMEQLPYREHTVV